MIIFVTGKSGSGKSTFAKELAEEIDYKYVDVDSIAHSIYEISSVLQQVKLLFGKEIFDPDGTFNRKKLGQIVFQERHSGRIKKFNDLTWQYMQIEIDKLLNENKNIVLDWILLPHTKYWNMLAYKILIRSNDDNIRFQKLIERDNVNIKYLELRDKASIEYCEEEFNYVICNDYMQDKNKEHIRRIKEYICQPIQFEVLGTKSPFALTNSACPSYYFNVNGNKLLLDCGSGSHRFFEMKNLNNLNIVISHLHRDHYNDLYNYMYTAYSLKNLGQLKEKIKIYLPTLPTRIVEDIKSEKLTYSDVSLFDKNTKLNINDLTLEFLQIEHDKNMDCYAIKLTTPKKKIVYTGDMSFSNKDRIIKFAKNCDVLICESSLLKKHKFPEINSHITAEQAAIIAKESNVKKLLLTHFWAEEDLQNYKEEAKTILSNVVVLKEQDKFYL